jgi:hypothetical protein
LAAKDHRNHRASVPARVFDVSGTGVTRRATRPSAVRDEQFVWNPPVVEAEDVATPVADPVDFEVVVGEQAPLLVV